MKTGILETRTASDDTSHDGFLGQLRIAITGGTSGLGLALVREFSARGARVAFLARHAEPVAKVERENKSTHGIVADVSDKDAISALFRSHCLPIRTVRIWKRQLPRTFWGRSA